MELGHVWLYLGALLLLLLLVYVTRAVLYNRLLSFRETVKQRPVSGAYYRLHDCYVQEAHSHHALHHFKHQGTHGLTLLTEPPMYCNVCDQLIVQQTVLCCQACRYVVHESCLTFAERNCKLIFLPPDTPSLMHHWIKGSHSSSRACAACGLSCSSFFGQISLHCAWCQRNCHKTCLEKARQEEEHERSGFEPRLCDLGALRRLVLDPARVQPLGQPEITSNGLLQRSLKYVQFSGASMGRTLRRQISRRSGAKRSPSSSKLISPSLPLSQELQWRIGPASHMSNPVLVLINNKSGGNQGEQLRHEFMKLLHPLQVWDLEEQGASGPLRIWQDVAGYRVLVCGGDGTAAWVLSALHELPDTVCIPPVGILPLGTGNDLAVCLKWGKGFRGEDVAGILQQVQHATPKMLDRWHVQLGTWKEDGKGGRTFEEAEQKLMMNYLGIGMDAEIAYKFHSLRSRFPGYFHSQIRNKLWYGQLGAESYFFPSHCQAMSSLKIRVDGVEIDLTGLEGVIISNITSYAGGAYLWGANNPLLEASLQLAGHADDQLLQERKRSARFKTPSFNDGLLEVVGIRNSLHMIQIQVGLTRAIRLGQGKEVLLETAKPTLVQVDGEPWHQQAGVAIRVTHQNQALMLARSAASAEEKSEADQQVLDGVVSVLQWAESTAVISKEQQQLLLAELARRQLHAGPFPKTHAVIPKSHSAIGLTSRGQHSQTSPRRS